MFRHFEIRSDKPRRIFWSTFALKLYTYLTCSHVSLWDVVQLYQEVVHNSKWLCWVILCVVSHFSSLWHGPLAKYVKLRVAHAPGMPRTFFPAADFTGNRYLAIPACIMARASRTCRDACRDRLPAMAGKTFPSFPVHAHPQFYVSGKRPIV